jgi:PIN domain nuclease of toxin-antitoxin system
MKYLLDTAIFLWSLDAVHRLNQDARNLLSSTASELYLSAASSWEIAIKFESGSLRLPKPPSQFLPDGSASLGLRSLDITHQHSLQAGALPIHHRDPFDRLLVAQAQVESMVLLTGHRQLRKYNVQMVFCGR